MPIIGSHRSDLGYRISDVKSRIPDVGCGMPDFAIQISDVRPRISGIGYSDIGYHISDVRHQMISDISDLRIQEIFDTRYSNIRFQTLDIRYHISDIGSHISDITHRISCGRDPMISDLRTQISDTQISDIGYRTSYFRIQVSQFKYQKIDYRIACVWYRIRIRIRNRIRHQIRIRIRISDIGYRIRNRISNGNEESNSGSNVRIQIRILNQIRIRYRIRIWIRFQIQNWNRISNIGYRTPNIKHQDLEPRRPPRSLPGSLRQASPGSFLDAESPRTARFRSAKAPKCRRGHQKHFQATSQGEAGQKPRARLERIQEVRSRNRCKKHGFPRPRARKCERGHQFRASSRIMENIMIGPPRSRLIISGVVW